MKKFIISYLLIATARINAQTTLYYANGDGSINKNSYFYFDRSVGKITQHHENIPFNDTTERYFSIIIRSNKIYIRANKKKKNKGVYYKHKIQTGYLSDNKRIIGLENGAPTELESPYIKNNKIYSPENKIIAFIEGKEIDGAALYLLSH